MWLITPQAGRPHSSRVLHSSSGPGRRHERQAHAGGPKAGGGGAASSRDMQGGKEQIWDMEQHSAALVSIHRRCVTDAENSSSQGMKLPGVVVGGIR